MSKAELHSLNKTVLYIEDDDMSALLVDRALRVRGYSIIHERTAKSGLEIAAKMSPALVLIDINLPDSDGYTLVAQLREFKHLKMVPIIALTAYHGLTAKQASIVSGCDGFLTKPIDINQFPLRVEHLLAANKTSSSSSDDDSYLDAYNHQLMEKMGGRVQELTEANHMLLEQQKQQEHTLLAISHELQAPFTAIRESVNLLLEGTYGELKPAQRQALQQISQTVKGLHHLLKNLDNSKS